MASLTATKAGLISALAATGVDVHDHIPVRLKLPAIIVGAGDPYLEEGDTFDLSQMKINLEVFLLVDSQSAAAEVKALDDLLQAAIPHLGEWIATARQPEIYTVNQSRYLGCCISLTTTFDLG